MYPCPFQSCKPISAWCWYRHKLLVASVSLRVMLCVCDCSQVQLAEGDMNSDDLGLSDTTLAKVLSSVQIVIHSAASIGACFPDEWSDGYLG